MAIQSIPRDGSVTFRGALGERTCTAAPAACCLRCAVEPRAGARCPGGHLQGCEPEAARRRRPRPGETRSALPLCLFSFYCSFSAASASTANWPVCVQ